MFDHLATCTCLCLPYYYQAIHLHNLFRPARSRHLCQRFCSGAIALSTFSCPPIDMNRDHAFGRSCILLRKLSRLSRSLCQGHAINHHAKTQNKHIHLSACIHRIRWPYHCSISPRRYLHLHGWTYPAHTPYYLSIRQDMLHHQAMSGCRSHPWSHLSIHRHKLIQF